MADISHVKLPNGQTYDLKDALLRNHLGDFEESSDCFPYTLRPTCDGKMDIGDRAYLDKIVGGTVAWNQLNNSPPKTYSENGITFTFEENGKVTITGTATGLATFWHYNSVIKAYVGHKVLVLFKDLPSGISLVNVGKTPTIIIPDNVKNYGFRVESGTQNVNYTSYICFFDLTQMFGSTIADYIYSLEQSTPGAGVAWFRKLFPEDYYPYNSGELISVSGVSAKESVGFNLFDLSRFAEEYPNFCTMSGDELIVNPTSYLFSKGVEVNIPADIAGGYITYECKCGTATNVRMRIVYADGSIIDVGGTSSTSWQTVVRQLYNKRITAIRMNWSQFGSFYIRNLCINLSWSGERNGEYEPYVKHTYPLDSTLTLRGIPKLDAQNNLYYDGDEYMPDGTVTRKYGIVDLGTLNWRQDNNNFWYTQSVKLVITGSSLTGYTANAISNKLVYGGYSSSSLTSRNTSGFYASGASYLEVWNNSITTESELKTSLSGIFLIYELDTPTTETADPYLPVIPIDKWGIESFVTSGIVPIGHKTRYVAKLDNLPSLAGGDGYYIIDQTGDKMSLSPITETHIPSLNASKITAGTLGADRIPALDASKISSGALSADRIPDLGASKITSGTFAVERIPDLNASKITDGTLSADRLPASGVTAGSYGPNGNQSPAHGGTFSVPSITADAKGRVTSASTKTVTLPTYSTATSSADGLMSATDKSKLDSITTVPLASGLNMTEGTDGLIFTYVS